MNDESDFIVIPRTTSRPVRIDVILAKRMRAFMSARRRQVRWKGVRRER